MPWATIPADFRVSDTPPYVGAREALDDVRAKTVRDEQGRSGDSLATFGEFGEAVAAWTLHYEADTAAARDRIVEMRKHLIPDDRRAELLGASLALTPPENRCAHWGDKTTCIQCMTEQQVEADDEARRQRKREAKAEDQ
jgi:hypothetical protein